MNCIKGTENTHWQGQLTSHKCLSVQPKSRIVEVTWCCQPVKMYRSQVGLWKNLIKTHAVHAKKKKRRRKERQICIKPHGQCSEVNIADSKEDDLKEGEETACGMRIGTFVFTVERRDNGQKNCQRNSNFARLMEPRRGWRRGRNQQRWTENDTSRGWMHHTNTNTYYRSKRFCFLFFRKEDKLQIGIYVKYQSDAYVHMPTHTLTVLGKEMTFLIVLGATHSFIKSDMFDTHPKNERMSC